MQLTVSDALDDYIDHLRAARRSAETLALYRRCVGRLDRWLTDTGRPTTVVKVSKRDVVDWFNELHDTLAPATVAIHYRHVRAFWNWLAKEAEISASPMATMSEPSVPDVPPQVIGADELRRILDGCKGTSFEDRRDLAILLVMLDTGARLGEMAGLQLDDFDRTYRTLTVTGKGDKTRTVAVGDVVVDALNRYIRVRRAHRDVERPGMWLGKQGALTGNGINQIVKRRARDAEVPGVHAHRFRHTFAHLWLEAGGREGDLMMLGGWTSPEMPRRYGRSAAAERAREAHRTHSPADRLRG